MSKAYYASIQSNEIKPILEESYHFTTIEQAKKRLDSIQSHFIISRKTNPDDESSITLWIRTYEVSTQEKKEGYYGHFGKISIKILEDDYYTLTIEKIQEEIGHHPQRGYIHRSHPNRSNLVLRHAKCEEWGQKGKKYPSEEEAILQLRKLHDEFPNISIPANSTKIFIQVYEGSLKPPVKKYVLDVEQEGDEFVICCREKPDQNRLPKHKIDEILDTTFHYLSSIEER